MWGFFCRAIFFSPEFNIRLYDKNSESDYFFFPPPKSEYFVQQHWESEYFFLEKNHNPPFKLNGRSLTENQMEANPDKFQAIAIGKNTKNENISFNLNGNIIKCEDEQGSTLTF